MPEQTLEEVFEIIKAEPHSSQALLLFGLIKTLDIDKSGHMYLLVKLKEMTAAHRQLAYQLMELMADGQIHDDAWTQFVAAVEDTIRNG
jgi:hypothetical protein